MPKSSPVYLQLRQQLVDWISEKNLTSQDKLPGERVLATKFQTTRVTLRQALAQLEAEGVIFRSNRRGWYVTPDRLSYDPSQDIGFNLYVRQQGFTPRTETISKDLILAPQWLAEKCGLRDKTPIYHFIRRRYVDERALLIEHNFVNPVGCAGLMELNTDDSLWQLLRDKFNLQPASRNIEIYPQALVGDTADLLNVNTGSAGLYLQRISHDEGGGFLEFDHEYWLDDALNLVVSVKG
ncbi:MAG: GntR family transcriptional regulator [Pseudomonadales bacterium]|nr:GntR family transcriptional regulator [Pseudomonadales bacterium]